MKLDVKKFLDCLGMADLLELQKEIEARLKPDETVPIPKNWVELVDPHARRAKLKTVSMTTLELIAENKLLKAVKSLREENYHHGYPMLMPCLDTVKAIRREFVEANDSGNC